MKLIKRRLHKVFMFNRSNLLHKMTIKPYLSLYKGDLTYTYLNVVYRPNYPYRDK